MENPLPKAPEKQKPSTFDLKDEWKKDNRYRVGEQTHMPNLELVTKPKVEGLELDWA